MEMLGSLIIALLVGLALGRLLTLYRRQTRINRLTDNWPSPRFWPIIGHMYLLTKIAGRDSFKGGMEIIASFTKEHRGKLWVGPRVYFFDCNPKDIRALFNAPQLLEKSSDYYLFENWLGKGVFTSSVEKWMHRRKMIMPAFNYGMIKENMEVFERQTRILMSKFKELSAIGEPIHFIKYANAYTLDTICETALGVSVGAQTTGQQSWYLDTIKENLIIIDTRVQNIFYRLSFYPITPLAARERRVLKKLRGFTEEIVQKRQAEFDLDLANRNNAGTSNAEELGNRRTMSLLDTLLQAKTPDGQSMEFREICEEVDTIIFGGFELVATTIMFFMYKMTKHPEYQQRIREEVLEVCGKDSSVSISMEQLNKLEFLEMCVKEILRLYPSGPMVGRTATADCQINDFFIPAGSNVMISPLYIGRCEEFFPDPLEFKPDRWARDAEHKVDPATYMPFLSGPRGCLGKRYAMVSLKLALAHLLRSFEFEAIEGQEDLKLKLLLSLHTANPFYCKVKAI